MTLAPSSQAAYFLVMLVNVVWNKPVIAQLQRQVLAAAPREMAAVLGGYTKNQTAFVERILPLANQSHDNHSFRVDDIEFARREHQLRVERHTFLGFAHSHPGGSPTPSLHDRQSLWTNCVQVISNGEQCRAFALDENRTVRPLKTTMIKREAAR